MSLVALPEVLAWAPYSKAACLEYPTMPESLQLAQIEIESGGNPNAKSPVGAEGLVQLMPQTARGLGVTNPLNPLQNLRGGAHLMSMNFAQWRSWEFALFAYNAGSGNLSQVMRSLGATTWAEIAAKPAAWGWAAGEAQGVIDYVTNILSLEPVYAEAIGRTPITPPVSKGGPQLPTLKPGDTGDAVKVLQILLNQHGHKLVVDGDFGPLTEAAVLDEKRLAGNLPFNSTAGTGLWGWLVAN